MIRKIWPGLVLLLLLAASPASAQTFGDDENVHKIQDVDIIGQKDEPLSLGFKTTTKNFLLPYALTDDGYVLFPRNDSESYYPLSAEEIADFQKSGLLPNPLPPYEVPMFERIISYALYPALVLIAIVWFFQFRNQQRKKAAAAAGATTPPSIPGGPDQPAA